MAQRAASNAPMRANESGNVPIEIVFHTGTSSADLTIICGALVEAVFLGFNWFCKTSCAAHCALTSVANRRVHAVHSSAKRRGPLHDQPVEKCDLTWQPISLPAVRPTAISLAHATTRDEYSQRSTSALAGARTQNSHPHREKNPPPKVGEETKSSKLWRRI